MAKLAPGKILIVDDDPYIILSLQTLLEQYYKEIYTLKDPAGIPARMGEGDFDVIMLDMNFKQGDTSGTEGMEWLGKILDADRSVSIIMITAYGGVGIAVEAIRMGAVDFVMKPWQNEKLLSSVSAAYQLSRSRRKVSQLTTQKKALSSVIQDRYSELVGTSPEMQQLMDDIIKVSRTEANVLILGENGTGKELVAREIHRNSLRAGEVLISVDLGSLAENLFESELFGHTRGAFTDAREDKTGRFEAAHGGTLFLDEIGNLSVQLQAKILSALQNREVYKVGSNKPIPVDIRLISATNRSLNQMVSEGYFRQDLLYRINTVEIRVPALRERQSDVPVLSEFYLKKYARKYRKEGLTIPDQVVRKLQRYPWPGNVRELQHAIERAVIMSEGAQLRFPDFHLEDEALTTEPEGGDYHLERLERNAIRDCLRKHRGNVTRAAAELGLTRGALYRRMGKYGL